MLKASLKYWRQPSFLLGLLGILIAFSIHFLEIKFTLRSDELHQTADDASYIRPAENLIDYGVWKDNSTGPSSYVQRPPITGIIHLIGMVIFQTRSIWFMFSVALLAHGLATALLYKLVLQFSTTKNAVFFTLVFILSPCFWGFLSYSISEAFLVSAIVVTSYLALTPHKNQFKRLLLACVCLYLFRPVLLLIFLPSLFAIGKKAIQKKERIHLFARKAILLNSALFMSICFLIFWEARKLNYTGSISPHPIYSAKNESIFREPHAQLTELFKIWEVEPETFHSITGRNWNNTLSDFNEIKRYTIAKSVPLKPDDLQHLLVKFTTLKNSDNPFSSVEGRIIREHKYGNLVEKTRRQIIAQNRLQYWIKTPFLSAKENLFKSHLNLTIFQETFRGNSIMELFRSAILVLILIGYVALIIVPFAIRNLNLSLIVIGAVLYFLFLIGYQRMNEDRYFLPLVVIGFICFSILTFHYSEYFRKRRKPRH